MIQKGFYPMLLLLLLAACARNNKKAAAPETPLPVITETVTTHDSGSALIVSGNVEGDKTVRLGFMVAGKINYIAAGEGQYVTRGQLVASLDTTNYSIAKNMADVQVRQAGDEYERLKTMYNRNSLPESDFKKVSFALDQAKNQQRLQAKNLSDTRLYTPISGVLLKKLAEVGEITGTGIPVLVISDISRVKINAYIPENELHLVKLGQQATVQIAALDASFKGKVTEVGSAADPASRAFTVKIELDNPGLRIRPGMIAEASLLTLQTQHILTVAAEALLQDEDGQAYVFVVDQRQGKAFKRKVSPGRLMNNLIEIMAGLHEGEVIVTGGQQKLTDGSPVTITK